MKLKKIVSLILCGVIVFGMSACDKEVKYEQKPQYETAKKGASDASVPEVESVVRPEVERLIAEGNSSYKYYNGTKIAVGKNNYVTEDEVFVPVSAIAGKFGISEDETGGMLVCGEASVAVGSDGYVSMKAAAEAFGLEYMYNSVKNTGILTKRTYGGRDYDEALISSAKATVLEKTKMMDEDGGDNFPEASVNGVYVFSGAPGWVGGFYPGLNFRCTSWSEDGIYAEIANKTTDKLSAMVMENNQLFGHDIGFVVYLSEYQRYLRNPNEESAKVVVNAADGLMARIMPGGYIKAWGNLDETKGINSTRMIIDTMCNLPLMFAASEITGDAAVEHAKVAQKFLARADATAAHTFVFNEEGTDGRQMTHQGARDDSNWARGLSWYVYGMAAAYNATGDVSFLNSAKEFADTYVIESEDDLICKWDFIYQNNKSEPYDTSAAVITACGMMNLYDITGDEYYKNTAYYIFESLYENYSAKDDAGSNVILYHATGNYPQNKNIDVALIYGDYYFAELIARLCGEDVGY